MKRLKRIAQRIRAYFPERLPIGVSEFDTWAASIIDLSGLPDNYTTRGAVAVMVMNLKSDDAYKPKEFFIRCLIKTAASQVSHSIFQELKIKQQEDMAKAAAAAAATESTTPSGPESIQTTSSEVV